MKHVYTLTILLLIVLKTTYGQQNPRLLNITFNNVTVGKAITELQAQSNYRFYYDDAKLDTVKITVQGTDLTLPVALNMVFKNTDYHYTIVNQLVFITKGSHVIDPNLITNITPARVDTKTNAPLDYTDNKNQPVAKATLENKVYDI